MTTVDVGLLLLFAFCAGRGLFRGMFREIMGLAGVTLGCAAAVTYWEPAAAVLGRFTDFSPLARQGVAALFVFVVVNLGTRLAAMLLDRLAKAAYLSSVTRTAGAIVGLGKGAIAASFLLLLIRTYAPLPAVVDAINQSTLGPPLADAASRLLHLGLGTVQPEEREA